MVVASPSHQADTNTTAVDNESTPSLCDIQRECESIRAGWTKNGTARKTRLDKHEDRIFQAHLAFARLLVSMR